MRNINNRLNGLERIIIYISWYGIVVISIMPKYYRVLRSRELSESYFMKLKKIFYSNCI